MKQKFKIEVSREVLDDLKVRLKNTRWISEVDNADWKAGTNRDYLRNLCKYWQENFDWDSRQATLNELDHYIAETDGIKLHFIHVKGKGKKSMPLLLTHGYPDSFTRFLKVIPLLTAADENDFSFDLVIPSIPGFGFSKIPAQPGMNPMKIAGIFNKLMTDELGYKKYFAHGGDWGSTITEQIAIQFPENLFAIHLTDIPFRHLFEIRPADLKEEEKKYLELGKQWQQTEGGYAMIQSTKPQSLSYGLNDSPAGLAGWIIEKFYGWSDCNGDIESVFTKDELLTNLTIYWATKTIISANRIYYEMMQSSMNEDHKQNGKIFKVTVPTGAAIFPKDLITAPKAFAERVFNLQHWTDMKEGGHFAAMEKPQLLAGDIRKFFSRFQS